MPTKDEMAELRKICEHPPIQLLERNKNFGPTNLAEIMKSSLRNSNRYENVEILQAANLIEKCIMWVPNHRIKAIDALKHPFVAAQSEHV